MHGAIDPALIRPASWARRLTDRWLALRDRLLASPRFQRQASGFVLTRPVARRRAAELFDLVAGFAYSQVLLACVQLRLFPMLAEGPQPSNELARRLGLTPQAADCLLDAAMALRLVERRGGDRYGLGELGAPLVHNVAVEAMVLHHAALYADLADPVALLRATPESRANNALARYWAYGRAGRDMPPPGVSAISAAQVQRATSGGNDAPHASAPPEAPDAVATYSSLMSASQSLVAQDILDAYPLRAHQCLLDVGGGDGSFLISAAQQAPALRLMLFDLPAVTALAHQRLIEAGLGGRAQVHGGSFLTDALPQGADLCSLVRVIHDHDDAAAMTILRAVHAALPPGGSLLLAEPMAGTPGAEAMGAYFGFYLLAMGRGRPRTAEALTQMLHHAGFEQVRARTTRQPLQTRVLLACRPCKP